MIQLFVSNHDQALIPIKTLDFHNGVNVTLGLDFIRTSPDHGTAFDIAGKNLANPQSLISAINLAYEMSYNKKCMMKLKIYQPYKKL